MWIMGNSKRSGIESRADALRTAVAAIGGAVGPEPVLDPRIAKLPRPPRFENEGARLAAADAGITKFLGEHGGDDVAVLVKIAGIDAKLNKGDAAGAVSDADAWLAANGSSVARPVVLEVKARAQVAAGQKDGAKQSYDELAKAVGPGQLRAAALTALGDLENPVLNGGAGDAAKAKASYQAALAALPPEAADDEVSASVITGKPGLRGQIENHLGLLP